jgi:hypothetical protein
MGGGIEGGASSRIGGGAGDVASVEVSSVMASGGGGEMVSSANVGAGKNERSTSNKTKLADRRRQRLRIGTG